MKRYLNIIITSDMITLCTHQVHNIVAHVEIINYYYYLVYNILAYLMYKFIMIIID